MFPSRSTLNPSASRLSRDKRLASNCSGCVNSPYSTSGTGNVNSSRSSGKANFRKVTAPPARSRHPAREIRKAKREKVELLARVEATPKQAAKPRATRSEEHTSELQSLR